MSFVVKFLSILILASAFCAQAAVTIKDQTFKPAKQVEPYTVASLYFGEIELSNKRLNGPVEEADRIQTDRVAKLFLAKFKSNMESGGLKFQDTGEVKVTASVHYTNSPGGDGFNIMLKLFGPQGVGPAKGMLLIAVEASSEPPDTKEELIDKVSIFLAGEMKKNLKISTSSQ